MSIKTCKTAICASALMAVVAWSGGVFATISQDFETDASGIDGAAGTVGVVGTTTPDCGYPMANSAHTKVLAITGTVTYTESATPNTGASQVDLMFKAEPTDELDELTDQTDVKVALAVATNSAASKVSIMLWCKAKDAATASWVQLCTIDEAAWARATLILDYASERCRVSINGDPQITESADEDAWYIFANGKGSDSYLKSVTMTGSTAVDDFVVTHDALSGYTEPFDGNVAIAETGVTITYDDLNKYGITKAQAEANADVSDNANMTISQKLTAGLNPKSATKFEMQTMTATSATAATITFPGNKGANGYTVTATADAAGTGAVLDTASVTPGAANADGETINSAAFSHLPDNDLIYFHLKTN